MRAAAHAAIGGASSAVVVLAIKTRYADARLPHPIFAGVVGASDSSWTQAVLPQRGIRRTHCVHAEGCLRLEAKDGEPRVSPRRYFEYWAGLSQPSHG